jgi:transketolase
VARGGYVLVDAEDPQVQLLATGSEVSLAVEAAQTLAQQGIAARVISLPCLEWFEQQDRAYRDSVIIPSVRARVSVEAGATLGWHRYVGDAGRCVGLDHFGASADAKVLFREFNITADAIVNAALESITASRRA